MNDKLKEAAKPLAAFLAARRISDPVHKFVLADLYDMVNEIRDEQIAAARRIIQSLITQPDFGQDASAQTRVANCKKIINLQQGIE